MEGCQRGREGDASGAGGLEKFNYSFSREKGMHRGRESMEIPSAKWEDALQRDPGLRERLRRLDDQGNPAARKGDLLCLAVQGEVPLVVSWNGSQIKVERRKTKNPFCLWKLEKKEFTRLFVEERPPILVAMNRDQGNIKMKADHHNGSLAVSCMVMLQECGE